MDGAMQKPCSVLGKGFPGEMSPHTRDLRQEDVGQVPSSAAKGAKLRKSVHGAEGLLDGGGHLTMMLKNLGNHSVWTLR